MRSKQSAEGELRRSLEDKELLLKELHHRVKNNLQIICSLLRLQSAYLPQGPARTMLRSSEERVKCMALVHEELYRSASLSRIGFHVYASELTKQLLRSHGIAPERCHLSLNLEPVEISIDKAVPSGLILNELIANAIEHGCGSDGVLSLSLELRNKGAWIEFRISDRGPGLGRNFDLLTCSSLGIRMVSTLCKQLRGRLTAEDDHGAVFTLEFPP
jgi:two-component sensor histidine kinase